MFLKRIPIRRIDFSNANERVHHNQVVQLVEQILPAKKQWSAADVDYEKRRLDQFCADLDREIDRLVYQLYDLTNDEIAIVEGAAR